MASLILLLKKDDIQTHVAHTHVMIKTSLCDINLDYDAMDEMLRDLTHHKRTIDTTLKYSDERGYVVLVPHIEQHIMNYPSMAMEKIRNAIGTQLIPQDMKLIIIIGPDMEYNIFGKDRNGGYVADKTIANTGMLDGKYEVVVDQAINRDDNRIFGRICQIKP